jgi:hypothetical protein
MSHRVTSIRSTDANGVMSALHDIMLRGEKMPASTPHRYKARSKVWLYDGPEAWHFITLSGEQSSEIACLAAHSRSAWGSIRVIATVGRTSWKTSIFPDKKRGAYLLPLKAAVRTKEKIEPGDTVAVTIELVT